MGCTLREAQRRCTAKDLADFRAGEMADACQDNYKIGYILSKLELMLTKHSVVSIQTNMPFGTVGIESKPVAPVQSQDEMKAAFRGFLSATSKKNS